MRQHTYPTSNLTGWKFLTTIPCVNTLYTTCLQQAACCQVAFGGLFITELCVPACCPAGKVVSPGELLTALGDAPLDTIYLDAAGQEKGERGGKAAASMVSSSCSQETDWAAAAATCPLVDSSKGWLVLHL